MLWGACRRTCHSSGRLPASGNSYKCRDVIFCAQGGLVDVVLAGVPGWWLMGHAGAAHVAYDLSEYKQKSAKAVLVGLHLQTLPSTHTTFQLAPSPSTHNSHTHRCPSLLCINCPADTGVQGAGSSLGALSALSGLTRLQAGGLQVVWGGGAAGWTVERLVRPLVRSIGWTACLPPARAGRRWGHTAQSRRCGTA